MTALRAQLDLQVTGESRRTARRRKLHLPIEGAVLSGAVDVLIMDMSTTGILLETSEPLREGEAIELDMPEAAGASAIVKWSSGQLFGCKFRQPISTAAVSAALLRSSFEQQAGPASVAFNDHNDGESDLKSTVRQDDGLSFAAKMRWIVGLTVLSWATVYAVGSLIWSLLH